MAKYSRPWSDLAAHYEELLLDKRHPHAQEAADAIGKLCQHIAHSFLNDVLFGHTSHHTLRISQVDCDFPAHPSIQWLVISPAKEGLVHFELNDTSISGRRWNRIVAPNQTQDRFEKFLHQVGWVRVAREEP